HVGHVKLGDLAGAKVPCLLVKRVKRAGQCRAHDADAHRNAYPEIRTVGYGSGVHEKRYIPAVMPGQRGRPGTLRVKSRKARIRCIACADVPLNENPAPAYAGAGVVKPSSRSRLHLALLVVGVFVVFEDHALRSQLYLAVVALDDVD